MMKTKYIAPEIDDITAYEENLMDGLAQGSTPGYNPGEGQAKSSGFFFDDDDDELSCTDQYGYEQYGGDYMFQ